MPQIVGLKVQNFIPNKVDPWQLMEVVFATRMPVVIRNATIDQSIKAHCSYRTKCVSSHQAVQHALPKA